MFYNFTSNSVYYYKNNFIMFKVNIVWVGYTGHIQELLSVLVRTEHSIFIA